MNICEPYNGEDLVWHPVTPSMSKISFQGPECCKPLKRKSIATFFKPKSAPGTLQLRRIAVLKLSSMRNGALVSSHAGWASNSRDTPQWYARQAVRWLTQCAVT